MTSDLFAQRGIGVTLHAGKGRVLVVDEDSRDLKFYRLVLEGQGFEVFTCASYEAALSFLDHEPFDLVLVSQGSNAFEGRVVVDRAMQLDRHRAVLVVTQSVDMGCYLEAMQMGAADYLEKPLAPAELLRFVQGHVQGKRASLAGGAA